MKEVQNQGTTGFGNQRAKYKRTSGGMTKNTLHRLNSY